MMKSKLTIQLALISLLAATMVEFAIRALGLSPTLDQEIPRNEKTSFRAAENPILGYELIPGYTDLRPDNVESFGQINALGFRDRERTIAPAPHTKRLLMFGGAVAAGSTLIQQISETIPQRLEASLRRMFPASPVEVLNFGVPWYSFRSEIELLETRGLSLQPELAVLLFIPSQTFQKHNLLTGRFKFDRPLLLDLLYDYSATFRFLATSHDWFHFASEIDVNYQRRRHEQALEAESLNTAYQRLSTLKNKINLVVLLWPDLSHGIINYPTWMNDPHDPSKLVPEALCVRFAIRCIRLSSYVEAAVLSARPDASNAERQAFVQTIAPDGTLLTVAGADLLYSAIRQALLESGLLRLE